MTTQPDGGVPDVWDQPIAGDDTVARALEWLPQPEGSESEEQPAWAHDLAIFRDSHYRALRRMVVIIQNPTPEGLKEVHRLLDQAKSNNGIIFGKEFFRDH